MATLLKSYTGSTASTNTNAFYVVAELYSENEWITGGHYLYVNYYVYVSDGQNDNFTNYCRASWTSDTFALSKVGKYAETRVDIGWTGYGETAKISSANAWYEGGSGTIYKSTLSEQTYTVESCQHTVKYDANGGTGAPSSQTKTWGSTITLSTTKPTREGYTFNNWNTQSDGSGASYDSGATYGADQKGGTVTLYAQWTANTYTIQYYANGGSGSMEDTIVTYNTESKTRDNAFTRSGYKFKGWTMYRISDKKWQYTLSDGTREFYIEGSNPDGSAKTVYKNGFTSKNASPVNGDIVVLSAQWEPNQYVLTLLKNDGSSEYTAIEVTYDSNECADLSSVIPDRLGYKFLGWFADTTAEDQVFDENGICINDGTYFEDNCYVYAANLTLLAYWEPLNIAYCKVDETYKLCFTYYKKDGEWKKAILYKRINDTYERSIVNE